MYIYIYVYLHIFTQRMLSTFETSIYIHENMNIHAGKLAGDYSLNTRCIVFVCVCFPRDVCVCTQCKRICVCTRVRVSLRLCVLCRTVFPYVSLAVPSLSYIYVNVLLCARVNVSINTCTRTCKHTHKHACRFLSCVYISLYVYACLYTNKLNTCTSLCGYVYIAVICLYVLNAGLFSMCICVYIQS